MNHQCSTSRLVSYHITQFICYSHEQPRLIHINLIQGIVHIIHRPRQFHHQFLLQAQLAIANRASCAVIETGLAFIDVICIPCIRKFKRLQSMRDYLFLHTQLFHCLQHTVDVNLLTEAKLTEIASIPFIHVLLYHRFIIDISRFLSHIHKFFCSKVLRFMQITKFHGKT